MDYSLYNITYCDLSDIMYTPIYSQKRFDEETFQMEKWKKQCKNPNITTVDKKNLICKLEKNYKKF